MAIVVGGGPGEGRGAGVAGVSEVDAVLTSTPLPWQRGETLLRQCCGWCWSLGSAGSLVVLTTHALFPGVQNQPAGSPCPDAIPQRGIVIRIHAKALDKDYLDPAIDQLGRGFCGDHEGDQGGHQVLGDVKSAMSDTP